MLRFVSFPNRTLMSSMNINVLRLIRPISNQTKSVPTRPTEEKKMTRRPATSAVRQVNLRKLFSDEETDGKSSVVEARRPNILHSSSIDSTKKLKERETNFNVDDQRRPSKQNQKKTTNLTTEKKTPIETNFDGSELISAELEEKLFSKPNEIHQPKQPRKEKSARKDEENISGDVQRQSSTAMLTKTIREVTNVEDLLEIFDKYVVPTELALGLQRLSQLASEENNNAVEIYNRSDNSRQRMETLIVNFLNKFTDHEVLTAISFVAKFYPEDNEFTDKFALGLNNRLRRISIHQIVRILEELKISRYTAQWVHRTYNRLLSLAEGRYFEFDNIRDILAISYKLSYNDRLINRLDERILEIADSLTFDDWFKVLINKSMLKRRDRTILRAACYHLLKLSESNLFPLDKLKDCLLACAMLNFHDKPFLERLIRDVYEQINQLKDPFLIQSIITSMGNLRLRHCDLLDAFGRILLEESESFGTLKNKCLQAFIRTCAAVNYSPPGLTNLIEHHLKFDEISTDETNSPLTEIKNRIDLVWSLAILDQANPTHLSLVLNQDTFQQIQNEVISSKIASALKLLTIYSYSLQKFAKKFLKPSFNIEQLAQQLTLKNANAQDQLAKTIVTFAAENKFSKFSVVTSNMIVIDCLMVVDKQGTPQDLTTILTSSDNSTTNNNGQTTFNRVRIDENLVKIALKCLDYQDKTLLTDSIVGSLALQMRLLNSLGYKCVPIHYDEFSKIQVVNDRVKFLQRKIKETINPTSTVNEED